MGHLAQLWLPLWLLQRWLCRWSGFSGEIETVLEKRFTKQLLSFV
jgi:hypothetical protein